MATKQCLKDLNEREDGAGLSLSGGGFRATLFHLGSLRRLNELGWLKDLPEITSVSGGSIISAWLGLNWKHLDFQDGIAMNFNDRISDPILKFCSHTMDYKVIPLGLIDPFRTPADYADKYYRKHLFGQASLQDLPDDKKGEGPRFTIYSTNMKSGVSFRFARPYMTDYKIGYVDNPAVPLGRAVAASSAFPPFLTPLVLNGKKLEWKKWDEGCDLFDTKGVHDKIYLTDGGVYDNLGIERTWDRYKTVIISDAGAPFKPKIKPWRTHFWITSLIRTIDITMSQVGGLRERSVVSNYKSGELNGAYWGIGTKIGDYRLVEKGFKPPMTTDSDITGKIKELPTCLRPFSSKDEGHLINWGYALTDAAMRRYAIKDKQLEPGKWPVEKYPL